mgnify:CR=1 FL=1
MNNIAKSIDSLLEMISNETGIPKNTLYNTPLEKISEMITDNPRIASDRFVDALRAIQCAMMEIHSGRI